MFLAADPLVKAVILSLVFASLVTWTVFLAKSVQLTWAERRLRKRLKRLTAATTLTEAQSAAGAGKNVLSTLVSTAVDEVRVSAQTQAGGVQARAASRLADVVRSEGRVARNGNASGNGNAASNGNALRNGNGHGHWGLTAQDVRTLRALKTPIQIQKFIDSLAYQYEDTAGSPHRTLRERKGHCLEGALLC